MRLRARITLALTLEGPGVSVTFTRDELEANPKLLRDELRDLEGLGYRVEAALRSIQRSPFAKYL